MTVDTTAVNERDKTHDGGGSAGADPGPDLPHAATIASTATLSTARTIATGGGQLQLEQELRSVTPEVADRYELRGEIGRGGQARVVVAWDRHIGREVAWKELLYDDDDGELLSGGTVAGTTRFLREARITGQLEHPSIVPVHELGRRDDGTLYYTMRRVVGATLERKLKECASANERMKLIGAFWHVCNAIAYAHSHGVIHRDLKPANVMVGEFGETVVLDWGLAKVRGTDDVRGLELARRSRDYSTAGSSQTVAGFALGTPSYMSPEQARGLVDDIDERSDVWGLGAVLYEILTGRAPFEGSTVLEVLGRVIHEPPVPVADRAPEAPPELVAIVAKALSKDRSARYESAKEMAEDVSAYMTGRRVLAYEYSPLELLQRFARRYRAAVASAVAVLFVVLAALVVLSFAWRNERASRNSEREARLRSNHHLAQALTSQSFRLLEQNNLLSARVFAAASLVHNPANPWGAVYDEHYAAREPDAAWLRVDAVSLLLHTDHRFVQRLAVVIPSEVALTHSGFTADGKYVIGGDYAGTVLLADAASGRVVERIPAHTDKIHVVAVSSDPALFATAGNDRTVRVWRIGQREPVKTSAPFSSSLHALGWSPDLRTIAVGQRSGKIAMLDAASLEPRFEIEPHTDRVRGLEFSPDGKWLASSSWDKTARIYEAETGKVRHRITGHDGALYELAFSPDSRSLATASWDRTARVWDVETGVRKLTLEGSYDALYDVDYSPDGRWIATGGLDHTWRLWDAATGKMLTTVDGGSEAVTSVVFAPDGRSLVTAAQDSTVRVWALAPDDGILRIQHGDWVGGVTWSPDGGWIATAGADRAVRLWDGRTGARVRAMTGHTDTVYGLAFSPDGKRLASGAIDDTVRLWDVATGQLVRELRGHKADVQGVRFTPDGRSIVSGSHDGTALVWDAASGEVRMTLAPHGDWSTGIAVSQDGRRVVTACNDRLMRLWDLQTGKLERTFAHADWVSDVALSRDGKRGFSVGKDRRVIEWDLASGARIGEFTGHRQWVNTMDISSDERWLATGSDDRVAVIWDLATRQSVLHLRVPSAVQQVRFSPDGGRIAVASDETVTVFPVDAAVGRSDAQLLSRDAQQAAGVMLEGFELEDVHNP